MFTVREAVSAKSPATVATLADYSRRNRATRRRWNPAKAAKNALVVVGVLFGGMCAAIPMLLFVGW